MHLTTGADLVWLGELDQKLWMALACPTEGIDFDRRTLELLDRDKDGRIHASEVIAAAQWTGSVLADVEQLAKRSEALPLSAIDRQSEEGKLIYDTARELATRAQSAAKAQSEPESLGVAQITMAVDSFNQQAKNGDGIVPAEAAGDPQLQTAIAEVIACTDAAALDRSGRPGVTAESIEKFYTSLAAYVSWLDAGELEVNLPLGAASKEAHDALLAVRDKIDDYFTRCRVAAYDSRALAAINREETEYLAVAARDLKITAEEVAHFPLARVVGLAPLPLDDRINPAWTGRMALFHTKVVIPIVGNVEHLGASDWMAIRAQFESRNLWYASRPALADKLDPVRARALFGDDSRARMTALVVEDKSAERLAAAIDKVEKLVRFNRDLLTFANNFVSFRDFYSRTGRAMFQVGTLYIDKRACQLSINVNDAARHTLMSTFSKGYLLYCDLRNARGIKKQIVAMVTDGDRDNLIVGRNGLFYESDGSEWDATIAKIVDNPLSVREAFWLPYKKLLRILEEQVAKRAAAAEASSDAKMSGAATFTDQAVSGKPQEPKKFDVGVVAALGVAVGGIVAALGAVLQTFFGLGFWMPLGLVGLLLVISGPSMAVAWLKLRQRNLGPLLDANGWAVNATAKINVPLGRSLTQVAVIPAGSERNFADPFREKRSPWWFYAVMFAVVGLGFGWYIGKLDRLLPEFARSTTVLGDAAPAHVTIPPPAPPAP